MGRIKVIEKQNTFFECDNCGQEVYELDTECFECGNPVDEISKTVRRKDAAKKDEFNNNGKPERNNSDEEKFDDTNFEEDFFSPKGRLGRKNYFIRFLLLSITGGILSVVSEGSNEGTIIVFLSLITIVCSIFAIIQVVKRLHDINMSGWYWLLFFIPLINLIFGLYLLFKDGTYGANKYGEDPKKDVKTSSYKTDIASLVDNNTPKQKQPSTENKDKNYGLNDLEKLADLRDKGIITEEEFSAKKKDILGL
jgi:uncharacterized membrane protein YhaH (DUF805 family)